MAPTPVRRSLRSRLPAYAGVEGASSPVTRPAEPGSRAWRDETTA
jgi:hypothetical protein